MRQRQREREREETREREELNGKREGEGVQTQGEMNKKMNNKKKIDRGFNINVVKHLWSEC